MNEAKKRSLIKNLLNGRLTKKRRKAFADLEPVDREIRKQWNESGSGIVDLTIKEQIWEKVKARCEHKKNNQVLVVLGRKFAAASLITLVVFISLWLSSKDEHPKGYTRITAQKSRMYILPDSTKVWMDPGSSIQYVDDFNKNRTILLSGSSLFEVCKHEGSTFRIHIDKATIEVKGTCFLVKQNKSKQNEITLFNGEIEFTAEATGEKVTLLPSQQLVYNTEHTQMQINYITAINWKDGRYTFDNIPLEELIRIVNQKYDSNIVLNTRKKGGAFSGSIRYDESLDDILYKICFTLNLTKKKQNGQIIIY